ncbi:MAG: 4Fe-4S dicluster domain-containing protein [Desulfobacterales bacterium]|uniref:4Fe-4S dicluster domain-containing protein n=1 Tax=Candidatus Desulfaltia bathyphila TaxID=2841697 RepID=A0A8J6T6S3_9BACT|nr:4Fe-4S dicluster domain-containing protein [Candidatus Desulfaltia bathyphila]MBL7195326.1 4Fe-4S dicluster domain-containing protein [Desulfobacterales bacterium]MBL7207343.1 4Fe-4S dicluster domain-containing protein [Desulfobacterales bacterium]
MKVVKIDKRNWAGKLEKLKESYRLFGPVKDNEFHIFERLDKGELPDFNYFNTRLSPKSIIYPQSETMLEFSLDKSKENHHILKETDTDCSPRAVIGIRPCDAAAFLLVKRNFDTAEHKDPYWVKAYETTTFVGLACNNPQATCFCTSAGCGPFYEEGLDLLLVDMEDHYFAKIITSKGENLLEAAGWNTGTDADPAGKQIKTMKQEAEAKITSSITTDKLKDKTTTDLFDAPFWEEVAFACINCGTCTYVCPTCWCFDIQDEVNGYSGIRMRNWDSCMFPLFTLHGSGHNPRSTNMQRVRQRFMHKLKYYMDKYDNGIQCVGCGRCIRLCPVNIDIRKVCDLMNSYGD